MNPAAPYVLVAIAATAGLFQPSSAPSSAGKPAAATAPAKGEKTVASLGFLTGTWTGKMGEDLVDETWSAPSGDSIIGMFRWQAGGKETTMWELLAITKEADGPTLRLRHFGKDLTPWKNEAEGIAAMPATTIEASRVVFTSKGEVGGLSSVEYVCPTPGLLKIVVTFKDPKREALRFELARVAIK